MGIARFTHPAAGFTLRLLRYQLPATGPRPPMLFPSVVVQKFSSVLPRDLQENF